MMRVVLSVFVICLGLAGSPSWASAPPDPDKFVKELYDSWISAARAEREAITSDKQQLYALTIQTTEPYIDYDRLARLVLGQHWRTATPEQRKRFVEEFRSYLVRTYATTMLEYMDSKFEFKPTRYSPDDRQVVVRTETIPQNGRPPFPVNYVLYLADGQWKGMDVTIDGVSVVATLRNVIGSEISGKTLDAVIDDLAKKNRAAAQ
jgi:phospholipid transport system substrate-binding protein